MRKACSWAVISSFFARLLIRRFIGYNDSLRDRGQAIIGGEAGTACGPAAAAINVVARAYRVIDDLAMTPLSQPRFL